MDERFDNLARIPARALCPCGGTLQWTEVKDWGALFYGPRFTHIWVCANCGQRMQIDSDQATVTLSTEDE